MNTAESVSSPGEHRREAYLKVETALGDDMLTKERLVAEFEIGGTDAVWTTVHTALDSVLTKSFDKGYHKGKWESRETLRRKEQFWRGAGNTAGEALSLFVSTLISVLVLGVIGGGLYLSIRNQVEKGGRQMAACSNGQTFPCQIAMQGEYDDYNHKGIYMNVTPRGQIYLTGYRQATGHDLPPMVNK